MPLRLPQWPEKDVLAAKLIDYPVLNSMLRMLLYERLFRYALLALVLLMTSIALFVFKIWTASPKGFVPVVKLSGLDYVQAWSLRRTAEKEMARGRFDDALYSWRMAVANNPADLELLRGCLGLLVQGTDARTCVPVATRFSGWLLRLSQTNMADLELSARVYERFALDDLTLYSLAPFEKQLTPELEAIFLKALFNRNLFARFSEAWDAAQLRGVRLTDPGLQLYRAAYDAGWGLLSDAGDGKRELEAAESDPNRRVLAQRLQLKVAEHLVQPEAYRRSLDFLHDWRQDRLQDHIGYWQLLTAVGRKSVALKLIEAHVTPPASGEETVLLAKAFFDLGLGDKSREILEQYAPEFTDSEAVWMSFSNLLIEQERWDDLAKSVLLIRHEDNPLRDALAGYSYYLEGVAELKRGRLPSATNAFRRIASTPSRNRIWELVIAEKVAGLGFAEPAKDILLKIEKDFPEQTEFWFLLAKTAFDLNDPDLLVSALASAHKLRPGDPMILNNYAAALLATRQRPDEALRLTSTLLEGAPHVSAVRINHALALLQNRRLADAHTLLNTLAPAKLNPEELTSYHLAWFELHLGQNRPAQARQASERIDPQFLLPPEKQWLEKARLEMEAASLGKS